MRNREYFVYILSSVSGVLYIGVTNNLGRRVWEHKQGLTEGFSQKYPVKKLVYYEVTNDVHVAIEGEKQLKKWRREKKVALIESLNPTWRDLYNDTCILEQRGEMLRGDLDTRKNQIAGQR